MEKKFTKIKSISRIKVSKTPVYDIEVAKNHNFILAKGRIVAHNCDTGQALKAEGYPYSMISVDRVDPSTRICHSYQYFKSTIYEKRLEIFDHNLLKTEVTELERNIDNGKIDHPDGGRTGSKDISDAVCGAIFNASKHAEEYAYDYGETAEELLRLNSDSFTDDSSRLTLEFEEELKKMSGIMHPSLIHPSDASNNKISQYSMYNDIIIL